MTDDGPSRGGGQSYRYAGQRPLPSRAHEAFYSLYGALAALGFDLGSVGRWSMFKAAAALGVGREQPGTPGDPGTSALQKRMDAARRGEPLSVADAQAMEMLRAAGVDPLDPAQVLGPTVPVPPPQPAGDRPSAAALSEADIAANLGIAPLG